MLVRGGEVAKRLIEWFRRLVWGVQDDMWLARHRAEFEEFKRLHSHLFEPAPRKDVDTRETGD